MRSPWRRGACWSHPLFDPLPPPRDVASLGRAEDVRRFRQGSRQWDALHGGQCTTSQASAALGLLEPHAGAALKHSAVVAAGGVGAYYRLRGRQLRSLEDLRPSWIRRRTSSGRRRPGLWSGARSNSCERYPPATSFPFRSNIWSE